MTILVHGVGCGNRGAEMMLCAIQQYFAPRFPSARFVVDASFGPFQARAKYGLWTTVTARHGIRTRIASLVTSDSFRKAYGLVKDCEVDVVLDASGFAFGDQWGSFPCEVLAKRSRRWRSRGAKLILLPQSFGPFSDASVRASFKQIVERADLVFARDAKSYQYVQDIDGSHQHVKIGHDFTNIVKGVAPPNVCLPHPFAAVVPNKKMLEETTAEVRNSYVSFLATCVNELSARGIQPIVVAHAVADEVQFVEPLRKAAGRELECVANGTPVELKGIIGNATVVVGSRFHALVGALSQGIPSISTSWSHKYEALFDDYHCPECVLSTTVSREQIAESVALVTTNPSRDDLINRLTRRAAELRNQVEEMLGSIAELIGSDGDTPRWKTEMARSA